MISTPAQVAMHRVRSLPALSENPILRYFSFSALYVAQGIPDGLMAFAIPAWMAMNGRSPAEIGGYVAVLGIPWSFKILVAPLMDRFTYLPMGRRRPWVIFGQLGLIISFITMAFVNDPLNNIAVLSIVGFWVSFFAAFQDVAVDGMAIDIVPHDQQARANGIMWGSKVIGSASAVAIGTYIINAYGFFFAVVSLSSVVVLIMMIPLLLKERPGEKRLPWTKGVACKHATHLQMGSWKSIFHTLVKVFFLESSIMMGIGAFSIAIGFSLMNTVIPIFTIQELGWSNVEYSKVHSIAVIIGGILGMVVGGVLVDKFGKKTMISIYALLLILLVASMAFFKALWMTSFFLPTFVILYNSLYTCMLIAIFATGMQLCWKRVAATQFTLYMAISNIGGALGAKLLGPLREIFAWEYVILSFAAMAFVLLIVVRFINFDHHVKSVDHLESEFEHF
jgi:MFS transporter, PAT family, beta-lactamase induction signal transducer AmpG